jgi:hypothetical protein
VTLEPLARASVHDTKTPPPDAIADTPSGAAGANAPLPEYPDASLVPIPFVATTVKNCDTIGNPVMVQVRSEGRMTEQVLDGSEIEVTS